MSLLVDGEGSLQGQLAGFQGLGVGTAIQCGKLGVHTVVPCVPVEGAYLG